MATEQQAPSKSTPLKPSWLQIPSHNLARAQAFYTTCLGFQMAETPTDQPEAHKVMYRAFHFPGTELASALSGGFVKIPGSDDAHVAVTPDTDVGASHGPTMKMALVYYYVDDIEGVLARVDANGGRAVRARTEVPGGGYAADFMDCEGNVQGLFSMAPKKAEA